MSLDYMLISGLLLLLLLVPSSLAAWADSRPPIVQAAFGVIALAMILWPFMQDPVTYHPRNWMDAGLRVAALIIP